MAFGRSKKPDPESAIPRTESVPPPPPPKDMFDPDVIEAADEEVQVRSLYALVASYVSESGFFAASKVARRNKFVLCNFSLCFLPI